MFFVASRELFLKQKKVESLTKPTHEDRMQLLNTNDGITLVTEGIVIMESLSQVPLRQNRQQAPVSSREEGGGERWPDCPKEEKPC